MMKACTKCGASKTLTDFWPDRRRGGMLPHCKSCKAAYSRHWRKANPEKGRERYWSDPQHERERHLIRKYGLNHAGYNQMLSDQGGCCGICRKTQDRAFDVDHNHRTGKIRGLLCTNCNRMIGHAADLPERLEAAAAYLRIKET